MFVRKKRNRGGSVSVQLIDKQGGRYRVVRTFGSSCDAQEIESLTLQAQQALNANPPGQPWLLAIKNPEEVAIEAFVAGLSAAQIRTVGPELICGALFNRIGFAVVPEELFRHLTMAASGLPCQQAQDHRLSPPLPGPALVRRCRVSLHGPVQ